MDSSAPAVVLLTTVTSRLVSGQSQMKGFYEGFYAGFQLEPENDGNRRLHVER